MPDPMACANIGQPQGIAPTRHAKFGIGQVQGVALAPPKTMDEACLATTFDGAGLLTEPVLEKAR